ncbi:BIR7B-like protein [Mya arenaria]|uniref:BIR7B-like protein n=1 Tax=Mya arenaria TaxID=6604 RepID=A0ABY7F3C9_MYAAR|nr:BIR7B-like protein [Mya arenaria]
MLRQGLRHWSKNDDPWTEHARFSLDCDHVKITGAGNTSDTFASPTNNGANAITGMDLMQEILTIEEERDCFDEKSVDRQNMVAELSRENQHLRAKTLCSYCKRLEVSLVFLPCGHLVSCNTCGNRQRSCVTCGSNVKGTVRTYNA